MKDSTDHGQTMCRWFAHPLGVCKAAHPLNSLSRLETRHCGPSLGLIHHESNRRNVENTASALRVLLDLNTSNGGNDRSSKSISHSWIECTHQGQENWLENCNYWQPSHPFKKSIKPEILKLREIDTSPWNYFPLRELLLVPLIILYGTEEGRVILRLSASLRLSRLRWFSRALTLSPRGCRLSSRSH